MSRGTPVTTVRIPTSVSDQVEQVIQRSHLTRFEGPWNLSAFIVKALQDKLDHYERSRSSRKNRKSKDDFQKVVLCEYCSRPVGKGLPGIVMHTKDGKVIACCADCTDNEKELASFWSIYS